MIINELMIYTYLGQGHLIFSPEAKSLEAVTYNASCRMLLGINRFSFTCCRGILKLSTARHEVSSSKDSDPARRNSCRFGRRKISLPLRKGQKLKWPMDQSLILDPKDLCPARKYSSGWFRNHFDILANGSLKQDKGIELCKDLWSHLPTGTCWFFFLPLLKALRPEVILLFLQTQTNTSVGSLTSQTNQPAHISIQQSLHASQRPLFVQKIRRNVSKPEAFRREL